MLSLADLRRAAAAADARFAGHRLERVVQPTGDRVALLLYGRDPAGESAKRPLLLCCHAGFGRISQLDAMPKAPDTPPAFASLLRARLAKARLTRACLRGDDRQLALHFEGREGVFELLLSLMGGRSNLYLLDGESRLTGSLRPLARTRRTLSLGDVWRDPETPPAGSGEERFADVGDGALLEAIEARYRDRESERATDDRASQLARALRKERKLAARRLARIEEELAEADRASELQRHGELLKGALGRVEPRATEVTVRDHACDEDVVIPIDPALSPQQNLQATFKRYQKLVRRLAKAGGQVDRARERVEEIGALEAELQALGDAGGDALEELAARPALREILRKHERGERPGPAAAPRAPRGPFRDVPRRLQPRRYRSRDGLEIWVGRSDEGNDHLSTRLARGKDLFFHLDGAPGSHVVLRTEGRSDPPPESLLDACEVAVHFSKFKNAGRADVHVVPIKNVKKPKGAKAGLVYVTGGKTVHLRREESRLSRVLSSRIEDD